MKIPALVAPRTLAPGTSAQGSLFFRIAPGPQRLALRHQAGGQIGEAAIDLKALSSLHLDSTSTTPPLSP